ncbi:hypothetical protein P7H17_09420 [Paenibacillus larvae]|nr:hypothetical protein [Paenibacillus larvae]MDT2239621.1 hypothetical protein [Paenibacillus larvae]MDT2286251.1 hypothetical protein [Paenibacillus larvae]
METDKEKIIQRGAPSLEPYLRGSGTKMVRRIRGKERLGSFPQNYICTCGGLKTKVIRFETDIESGQHAFGFGTGFLLLFKKLPWSGFARNVKGV